MSNSKEPDDRRPKIKDEKPLSQREAEYMGNQVDKKIPGVPASEMLVYGEVDGPENEDQYDAHHVDTDEDVE